uniref:Uncharacterized protein n=1 Tax=Arcella intermedia TaxID=1963864 RepID=A0A6B2LC02_9EUKA
MDEDKKNSTQSIIFEAANQGRLDILKGFDKQVIQRSVNKHKSNALHWAAGGGHLETCQWLVQEVGIPITHTNKQGRNALHWSARMGHIPVATWCIDNGVPVDSLTKDGSTPLQWAVWQGQEEMCRFLISKGANLHHRNYFGCNAGHWACMGGVGPSFLEFLQSLQVDFTLQNDVLHTPLHKAAFKGHQPTCQWLIENVPQVDLLSPDKFGRNAAEQAASNSNTDLAQWLQEQALHKGSAPGNTANKPTDGASDKDGDKAGHTKSFQEVAKRWLAYVSFKIPFLFVTILIFLWFKKNKTLM